MIFRPDLGQIMSEEEERPRFVTGGYGGHRHQWVKIEPYKFEKSLI